MPSDESGDETPFTDCVASGSELPTDTPAGRPRRMSVPAMFRRAETRKVKRPAPDRSSKSPRDPALPAAKRPLAEPAESPGPPAVELSAGALAAIRQLLDNGIAAVINTFENKFERIEKRLSVLESESMEKDVQIQQLGEQLARQTKINSDLQAQVDGIDINRRLSTLIFTCDDFGKRSANEDIEKVLVDLLNERITDLNLSVTDIHAAHRLQRDDKVIAKFVKRNIRDFIYESRFNMSSQSARTAGTRSVAHGEPGPRGGRRTSPLYISESLTPFNQHLYNQLLQVRKTSGGTKVASVFSRRGLVYCRTVKGGPNIRVPDEVSLRRIVGAGDVARPGATSGSPAQRGRGDCRPAAPAPIGGGPVRSAPQRDAPVADAGDARGAAGMSCHKTKLSRAGAAAAGSSVVAAARPPVAAAAAACSATAEERSPAGDTSPAAAAACSATTEKRSSAGDTSPAAEPEAGQAAMDVSSAPAPEVGQTAPASAAQRAAVGSGRSDTTAATPGVAAESPASSLSGPTGGSA